MKKLIELWKYSNPWSISGNGSKITRVLEGPTRRTLTSSSGTPSKYTTTTSTTSLCTRLTKFDRRGVSVVPILDQWVEKGGRIDPEDLHAIVKQLRKSKRFTHCLQIVEWLSEKKIVDPSPRDIAVKLDLISKVHGVEQAEAYFDTIPNSLRVWQVYGALLNCYAKAKLLEKAEATLQKIKELGYARTLSYNVMLTLYSQLGNHEKLDLLVREMEEKDITCDVFTNPIRLSAYGTTLDIDRMETLLMKMEADIRVTMDWKSYASAANVYLKAGAAEKAFATIKKAEHAIRGDRRFAYEFLITFYANLGKSDEVYRIWNLNKKLGKFYNTSYLVMIRSLCKLDNLDGAEKILKEWEAGLKYFDFRLPNSLISAYCKKGLMGKAELIVKRLIETGRELTASTWNRMSQGYVNAGQMDKAVEALKKEILLSELSHTPDINTLVSCFGYLNGKGDQGEAEEIIKSLQVRGLLTNFLREKMVQNIKKENHRSNASTEMGTDDDRLEVKTTGSSESE